MIRTGLHLELDTQQTFRNKLGFKWELCNPTSTLILRKILFIKFVCRNYHENLWWLWTPKTWKIQPRVSKFWKDEMFWFFWLCISGLVNWAIQGGVNGWPKMEGSEEGWELRQCFHYSCLTKIMSPIVVKLYRTLMWI